MINHIHIISTYGNTYDQLIKTKKISIPFLLINQSIKDFQVFATLIKKCSSSLLCVAYIKLSD